MSENCRDCFKDVRSRNDKLNQVRIDAQRFSTEKATKVAIFQEGPGFRFEAYQDGPPPGAIEVIKPL